MATLNSAILEAAHEDGLLPKRLTKNQALYLHKSALTANKLYWLIAEFELGIDLEQLEKLAGLQYNTLAQFTRFLLEKGLIYVEQSGTGKNIYFTRKRHKVLKAQP